MSDDEETSFIDLDTQQNSRKSRRAKKLEDFSKSMLSDNKVNGDNSPNIEAKSDTHAEKPENENVTENDENEPMDIPSTESKKLATPKSKKKDKKTSNKKNTVHVEVDLSNVDTTLCCAICKNEFPSKNKLFDHLKKTGHQVYLPDSQSNNISTKSQKKKLKHKT